MMATEVRETPRSMISQFIQHHQSSKTSHRPGLRTRIRSTSLGEGPPAETQRSGDKTRTGQRTTGRSKLSTSEFTPHVAIDQFLQIAKTTQPTRRKRAASAQTPAAARTSNNSMTSTSRWNTTVSRLRSAATEVHKPTPRSMISAFVHQAIEETPVAVAQTALSYLDVTTSSTDSGPKRRRKSIREESFLEHLTLEPEEVRQVQPARNRSKRGRPPVSAFKIISKSQESLQKGPGTTIIVTAEVHRSQETPAGTDDEETEELSTEASTDSQTVSPDGNKENDKHKSSVNKLSRRSQRLTGPETLSMSPKLSSRTSKTQEGAFSPSHSMTLRSPPRSPGGSESSTSKEVSMSPKRTPLSRRQTSLSPRQMTLSPKQILSRSEMSQSSKTRVGTLSPRRSMALRTPPRSPTASESGRSSTSKKVSVSRKQTPLSQRQTTLSPRQMPLSPKQMFSQSQMSRSSKRISLSQRQMSVSPRQSPSSNKPLTPRQSPLSQRQTPLSSRQTPLSQRKTPLSQRKTPLSQRQTQSSPKQIQLSQRHTPSSPRQTQFSQRKTPLSQRRTPSSPRQTPSSQRQSPSVSSKQSPFSPMQRSQSQTSLSPRQISSSPRQTPLSQRRRSLRTNSLSPNSMLEKTQGSGSKKSVSKTSVPKIAMSKMSMSKTAGEILVAPQDKRRMSSLSQKQTQLTPIQTLSQRQTPQSHRQMSLSPREMSLSPKGSLKKTPASLSRKTLSGKSSPNKSMSRTSLSQRHMSLRQTSLSPRQISLSPKQMSLSPRQTTLSPRQTSLSQSRRSLRQTPLSPKQTSCKGTSLSPNSTLKKTPDSVSKKSGPKTSSRKISVSKMSVSVTAGGTSVVSRDDKRMQGESIREDISRVKEGQTGREEEEGNTEEETNYNKSLLSYFRQQTQDVYNSADSVAEDDTPVGDNDLGDDHVDTIHGQGSDANTNRVTKGARRLGTPDIVNAAKEKTNVPILWRSPRHMNSVNEAKKHARVKVTHSEPWLWEKKKPPTISRRVVTPDAPVIQKSQAKQRRKTDPPYPRLPARLTRNIFTHFSRHKHLSTATIDEVEKVADVYWKNVVSDLAAYARHANRQTIHEADVELLLKRQRFVTDKTAMYTLVEKHMSLEHRQQIIPIAHAGNEVVPRH